MKERILSYAQDMEDIILWNVLKDVKNGQYVDVGANDPWDISVTQLFYDKGWRGINIEPLQDMHEALEQVRPEDTNLKMGAGQRCETIELLLAGNGSTCE
ncbi:MAG: FkbM family methyltransferase, partial [Spirochaetia bacterium]|nr:FkbM family methyltransferase [Spirochaetia bacterium]